MVDDTFFHPLSIRHCLPASVEYSSDVTCTLSIAVPVNTGVAFEIEVPGSASVSTGCSLSGAAVGLGVGVGVLAVLAVVGVGVRVGVVVAAVLDVINTSSPDEAELPLLSTLVTCIWYSVFAVNPEIATE